jgi:glutamine synthetase
VLIEAGLRGIEGEYEVPEEIDGDLRDLSVRERHVLGYEDLPHDLDEALLIAEQSELVAHTLGEQLFEFFLENKRNEWKAFRRQVTDYELREGLGL